MLEPTGRRLLAGLAVVASAALAAGCGSSSSAAAGQRVVARLGDLEIIHPFLPDPANPSVAAVYLTVRDTGSTPDKLVSATTPVTGQTALMAEDDHGSLDVMTPLDGLTIPAHGEASLVPGHDHLMLEALVRPFRVGQHIQVTLRFARAGRITVAVPVVPLDAIVNDDGMSDMKGM